MKALSIEKALKLYTMLSPYIPDIQEVDTGMEFVGKIVQSIVDSGHHRVYLEALALMMNVEIDDILKRPIHP